MELYFYAVSYILTSKFCTSLQGSLYWIILLQVTLKKKMFVFYYKLLYNTNASLMIFSYHTLYHLLLSLLSILLISFFHVINKG